MNKDEDYSLIYPELSKFGQEKTKEIIEKFSKQLEELSNNTYYEFTRTIADEIVNDDSWTDLRMKVINALCGYSDQERERKQAGTYLGQWWPKIRQEIYEANKEAIHDDIIKDKDYEIKQLKETIRIMQESRSHY